MISRLEVLFVLASATVVLTAVDVVGEWLALSRLGALAFLVVILTVLRALLASAGAFGERVDQP